ncbi:hypothetical protein OHU45_04390 [Streptomyces tubercidicus]|uniref:hypothetical protein n=1 Tax=Streptomyces tubercidicus TaxID=47759 RepID=UPI0030E24462
MSSTIAEAPHGITDTALSRLTRTGALTIASLGPAGTSSEQASRYLAGHLLSHGHESARVRLCGRYEEAGDLLSSGKADLAVVANAYAHIDRFYMNPQFRLAAVFVKDTPFYGIARAARTPDAAPEPVADPPGKTPVRIATHPAPRFLVEELLPDSYEVSELMLVDSTSAAAAAVASGEVPLALTTAPAARLHNLDFVSPTRPIRMVWSAFTRADLLTGPAATIGQPVGRGW